MILKTVFSLCAFFKLDFDAGFGPVQKLPAKFAQTKRNLQVKVDNIKTNLASLSWFSVWDSFINTIFAGG